MLQSLCWSAHRIPLHTLSAAFCWYTWMRSCPFLGFIVILTLVIGLVGLPKWHSGKEPACQCRRHKRCRFDPWIRKIHWRREWPPNPVFLPGESHDRGTPWATAHRVAKSQTWLSCWAHRLSDRRVGGGGFWGAHGVSCYRKEQWHHL